MSAILREIATYFLILRTTLAARMAYRGDFFISAVMMLLGDLVVPFVTMMIYRSGGTFPGWTFGEALLIQAIFMLAKGIAFPLFFGMVGNTLGHVRDGTFDMFLLKPKPALYMTIVTGFQTEGIGRLAGTAALFVYAIGRGPMPSPGEWLQFVLLFALSLVMLFACALVMSGVVFKWVGSSRVYEIFDSVTVFGMYPMSIFSKSFQTVVTIVVPVALIAFFPASALLGKPADGVWWSGLVSVLLAAGCFKFWHVMLRNYTSAGG